MLSKELDLPFKLSELKVLTTNELSFLKDQTTSIKKKSSLPVELYQGLEEKDTLIVRENETCNFKKIHQVLENIEKLALSMFPTS